MTKPIILDLFSGMGLAARGYQAAGFNVIGVDINPQPNYPGQFIQADAIDFLIARPVRFDAIHASPPCQTFTRAAHLRTAQGGVSKYPDLLTPLLTLLRMWNLNTPWVVENVPGAPGMNGAVTECGSAYGLQVQRHRLFLSNRPIVGTVCDHKSFPLDPITGKPRPWGIYHIPGDNIPQGGRTCRNAAHAMECMGITAELVGTPRQQWDSLKEGFPPAYTEHIGRQIIQTI